MSAKDNSDRTIRITIQRRHLLVALSALAALSVVFALTPAEEAIAQAANDLVCSGCVNTSDIANNAVKSGKIDDGTITSADIAFQGVKSDDIAPKSIFAVHMNEGEIGTFLIQDQGVWTNDIKDGTVTGIKIADGGVGVNDIATGAVSTSKIFNNAVTNPKLGFGSVTAEKMAAGSVLSSKIADDTIVEDDISPGFMKFVTLNDGQNGWEPDGSHYAFVISESAATQQSMILASIDGSNAIGAWTSCGVSDLFDNAFLLACGADPPKNGAQLQYIVFNS